MQVDSTHNSNNPQHTPIRWQEKSKQFFIKVWDVVKEIFKWIAHAICFFTNPVLYAIGFLAGIVWHEKVQETIEKISDIWKTMPWTLSAIAIAAAILCIQVTGAAASVLLAAHLGSQLAKKASSDRIN